VKILRELDKEVPSLIMEEASNELERIRKKYQKKFESE
jgi:hypothetical protein